MTDSAAITVVPADKASWEDLRKVFGERGAPHHCQCRWFKPRTEYPRHRRRVMRIGLEALADAAAGRKATGT